DGVERLRGGIRDWLATGSVTYQTYFLGLLAEALGRQGEADEGRQALGEAFDLVRCSGETLYEAELHRLAGELLPAVPDAGGGEGGAQGLGGGVRLGGVRGGALLGGGVAPPGRRSAAGRAGPGGGGGPPAGGGTLPPGPGRRPRPGRDGLRAARGGQPGPP